MKDPANTYDLNELLAQAGWIRGLIVELVHDPSWREDVEQDTWLTALEKGPHGVRNLRAWLHTVVLNAARQGARRRRRRDERERDAAMPEAIPSAADVVEQAEQQQRLVAAVLSLGEPYRATLLLRYFKERPSAEIARELGISASTVRNQVKRGLEMLRLELDREMSSKEERRRFLALLLAMRERPGSPKSPEPLAPRGAPLAAAGALCGVTLLSMVFLWWTWPNERQAQLADVPPRLSIQAQTSLAQVPQEPSRLDARQSPQRKSIESTSDAAVERPGKVTGSVVDEDGVPIPGARVTVADFPRFAVSPVTIGVTRRTDARGNFILPSSVVERSGLVLVAEFPGYAPELIDLEDFALVTLERAAVLKGVVLEEETGQPLSNARLTFGEYDWVDGVSQLTITDDQGRFDFDRAPAGRALSARLAQPGHAFQSRTIAITQAEVTDVTLYLSAGQRLSIRLVDGETGQGLEGAEIHFNFASVGRTADDGSFLLAGILVNQRKRLDAWLPGYCALQWTTDEAEPLPGGELVLPLYRECILEGVVLDASGKAIDGALVRLRDGPDLSQVSVDLPSGMRLGSSRYAHLAHTGSDGRFRMDGLAPWLSWGALSADDPKNGRRLFSGALRFGAPSERKSVKLEFPSSTASMRGRVLVNGAPVEARIRWCGSSVAGSDASDDSGNYLLTNLEAGPLDVQVEVMGRSLSATKQVILTADGEVSHDFHIVGEQVLLTGRIVHADGTPAADQSIEACDPNRAGGSGYTTTDSDGFFRTWVDAVDGAALIVVTRHGPLTVSRYPVSAGGDDFELVLPELGWLILHFPSPAGGIPPSEIEVEFSSGAGEAFITVPRSLIEPIGDSRWRIPVPLGQCDVRVRTSQGDLRSALLEGIVVSRLPKDSAYIVLLEQDKP